MTTLLGPILAVALMAQIQGGTLEGKVVDDDGKSIVNAEVVFFAPAPWEGTVGPVVVSTKTGAGGRYRLTTPPLGRGIINGVHVWAYRPGLAVTAAPSYQLPAALVLHKPAPKTVKVEGPGGQPLAGARISLRALFVSPTTIADGPDSIAEPLAVTTGADGTASLSYLASGHQLVAVRVTVDAIGTNPRTTHGANLIGLDDDRREASCLAADDPEAAAHDQRSCRRSPGQAGDEDRGVPIGRRARADLYHD
jgi:hypothetical protein